MVFVKETNHADCSYPQQQVLHYCIQQHHVLSLKFIVDYHYYLLISDVGIRTSTCWLLRTVARTK